MSIGSKIVRKPVKENLSVQPEGILCHFICVNFPLTDTLSQCVVGGEGPCFLFEGVNDNRHQTVADVWPTADVENYCKFQRLPGNRWLY